MSQHNVNIATSCCVRSVQFWGLVGPVSSPQKKTVALGDFMTKKLEVFFSFLSVYYSNEISQFKLKIIY